MSTLNVTTIKSKTASTPPVVQDLNGVQIGQFARAWVNFNGTGTVAIRASFNVGSITDNGTGDYTINFTTAMPDANYAWPGRRVVLVRAKGISKELPTRSSNSIESNSSLYYYQHWMEST